MVLPTSGLDVSHGSQLSAATLEEVWVEQAREIRPRPVLRAPSLETDEVLTRTIARFETVLRPDPVMDGTQGLLAGTTFPYIPSFYTEYIASMRSLGLGKGRRFLDVGCGIGTKMLMAWKMGWQVSGLDIYQPYLDRARLLLPDAPLFHADANEFEGFGDYELVYIYNPMVRVKEAAMLMNRIVSQMRPGSFLFAYAWLIEVPNATQISDSVWEITG